MVNHDNHDGNPDQLSGGRYYAVASALSLSSALSLIGSITICYLILKQKRWNELYQRLVFGISFYDALVSSFIFLQPYALPKSTGFPLAIGNDATCQTVGFFFCFMFASFCYNAVLSGFYVLMIRFRYTDRRISTLFEPWVHILAPGVSLLIAIAGYFLNDVKPNRGTLTCHIVDPKSHCKYDSTFEDEDCYDPVDLSALSLELILVTLTCAMAGAGMYGAYLVWKTMQERGRANLQHSVDGSLSAAQERRMRAVSVQALCYATSFFSFISWSGVAGILSYLFQYNVIGNHRYANIYFVLIFFMSLLFPLAGFWNWLIYIRPRLVRWKDANPDQSWFWSYQQVLSGKPAPTSRRTAHLREPGDGSTDPVGGGGSSTSENTRLRQRSWHSFFRGNNISAALQTNNSSGAFPASDDEESKSAITWSDQQQKQQQHQLPGNESKPESSPIPIPSSHPAERNDEQQGNTDHFAAAQSALTSETRANGEENDASLENGV